MAISGFDASLVVNTVNGVKNAYDDLASALISDTQNKFVNEMVQVWACPQAQKFFRDSFVPAMDSLITETNTIFTSVVEAINGAGTAWAQTTEGNYSPVSFSTNPTKIDGSGILESINGVQGIDLAAANPTASKLNEVKAASESALAAAVSAVNNSGFLGGNQEGNLIQSLNDIKSKMNEVVGTMASEVQKSIDSTVATYGDTQGKIESAFSGQ